MTVKGSMRGLAAGMLLALALAGGVSAQGMFYAEERKDGRIYVFNVTENWERFKASGETGTGLTRLGYGPGGETVYADNEQALELFNFKHCITETVARPKAPVQTIDACTMRCSSSGRESPSPSASVIRRMKSTSR